MTESKGFLDEIKQRVEKATPGPWQKNGTGTIICDLTEDCQHTVISTAKTAGWRNQQENINADFEFITHARRDIQTLVQLVEMLEDECKYLWNTTETYIQPQLDAYLSAANYLRQKREALALGEKIKENK